MRNGIIGLAAAAAFVLVSGLAFAQDKDLPAGGASTKDTTTTTYTAGGISQGALAGGTLAAIADQRVVGRAGGDGNGHVDERALARDRGFAQGRLGKPGRPLLCRSGRAVDDNFERRQLRRQVLNALPHIA